MGAACRATIYPNSTTVLQPIEINRFDYTGIKKFSIVTIEAIVVLALRGEKLTQLQQRDSLPKIKR